MQTVFSIQTMKHSKKDKRPRDQKGFSKGRKTPQLFRKGPITIEDILEVEEPYEKEDATIREMSMRTDPTNESSPTIKRRFRPLDNPTKILEVLQATLIIKSGVLGNNVTTGPNQYAYWRQCLAGEALRKFNEFATNVGTETIANLLIVEQRLITEFAPRDVLSRESRYMRYHMRKPYGRTTRQYVGAVHTLNETLSKMPPLFDHIQKIPSPELLDILASKAPQSHKAMMIEQGFDPQTATIKEFVEISERAETKEALGKTERKSEDSDSDDSHKASRREKSKRKKNSSRESSHSKRQEFFCKHHGPNPTHDSKTCKVLLNEDSGKSSWKTRDTKRDYKDHKSKYKSKARDLNLLHKSVKAEKEKWKKANARLQIKLKSKDDSKSESSDDGHISERKEKEAVESSSDSSSSSSSSSESSDSN